LLDDQQRQTTQILALSPDDVGGAKKMVERLTAEQGGPPGFPLLADPDHAVIDRYGQLNPERFKEYVVPHPAVFVIDRQGRVTWKFTNTDANIRASNEDILKALSRLHPR
jgi:peroxiredoxin